MAAPKKTVSNTFFQERCGNCRPSGTARTRAAKPSPSQDLQKCRRTGRAEENPANKRTEADALPYVTESLTRAQEKAALGAALHLPVSTSAGPRTPATAG